MFRPRGRSTNFVPAAIPLSASVSAVMWVPLVFVCSNMERRPTFGLGWTQTLVSGWAGHMELVSEPADESLAYVSNVEPLNFIDMVSHRQRLPLSGNGGDGRCRISSPSPSWPEVTVVVKPHCPTRTNGIAQAFVFPSKKEPFFCPKTVAILGRLGRYSRVA
ncbi:hypothetical protein IF1G_00372 [Cordyceps javanica]|uniref:Uncharacterized protein n=1 Tax=Cordyceps javanica TaxID=43265 RepID=A0A545VFF0_9HYPO|nr:hypothetical protein IF1G_00372 [Cordyceps javanica]